MTPKEKAINFSEWLAINHFRLININKKGELIWKSESEGNKNFTTERLYKKFKNK